jgi:hypothetical protein
MSSGQAAPGSAAASRSVGTLNSPLSSFVQAEMTALASEAKKVRGAGQAGEQIKEVCFTRFRGKLWPKSDQNGSISVRRIIFNNF